MTREFRKPTPDQAAGIASYFRDCVLVGPGVDEWLAGGHRRPWAIAPENGWYGSTSPDGGTFDRTSKGVSRYVPTDEEHATRAAWVAYWEGVSGFGGSAGSTDEQRAAAPPAPSSGDGYWVHLTWNELRDALVGREPAQLGLFA